MFYEKIELGLENMAIGCNALGNPEKSLNIIHIAGTNGKGSVGQLICANLISQGYKVGHFSSPSVLNQYDIWKINNKNISTEKYTELYNKAKKACSKATQFEIETLIAFLWFSESGCDYVVLETGMGGRLDATNITDKKLLCVITPIDIDHTKFLGTTLKEIAKEKAGIIKNNPAVSAIQKDEAAEILGDITYAQKPFNIRYYNDKTLFDYKDYKNIEIPLLGKYQTDNAALAIEALEKIGKFNIDGFKKAVWHCRFEKIGNFILDGAHNIHAIKALEENINLYFKNRKITFITGIFADKDYKDIAYIGKYADKIYTVESNNPRCLPCEKWAEELKKYNKNTVASESIKKAVELAKNDDIVLVFGSLSFMADAYREVTYLVQQNFE